MHYFKITRVHYVYGSLPRPNGGCDGHCSNDTCWGWGADGANGGGLEEEYDDDGDDDGNDGDDVQSTGVSLMDVDLEDTHTQVAEPSSQHISNIPERNVQASEEGLTSIPVWLQPDYHRLAIRAENFMDQYLRKPDFRELPFTFSFYLRIFLYIFLISGLLFVREPSHLKIIV